MNQITTLFTSSMRETTIFFIQLYRILRLHLTVVWRGLPTTRQQWDEFATSYGYRIQGMKFSLASIVTVLRTGRIPTVHKEKITFTERFSSSSKQDKKDSKQHSTKLKIAPDFRLNFFLCHPLMESPPILAINTRNYDFALQWDAEAFLGGVRVSLSRREVIFPHFVEFMRDESTKSDRDLLAWYAFVHSFVLNDDFLIVIDFNTSGLFNLSNQSTRRKC